MIIHLLDDLQNCCKDRKFSLGLYKFKYDECSFFVQTIAHVYAWCSDI